MAANRRPAKKQAKKAPKPPKPLRKKHERRIAAAKAERDAEIRAEIATEAASRARVPTAPAVAPMPGPDSNRSERVAYIVSLMVPNRWRGYLSRLDLVAAWGVTDDTVKDYASEAHRRLEVDPEEMKQLRRWHAETFLSIQEQARTSFSELTGLPDFAAAIKAGELAAKFQGVKLEEDGVLSGGVPLRVVVVEEPEDDLPVPPPHEGSPAPH